MNINNNNNSALLHTDIDTLYRDQEKDEFTEGIFDIHIALAAKALGNFRQAKLMPHTMDLSPLDYARKLSEHLKSADEVQRMNEYTWLIRGYFELLQGKRENQ